MSAFQNTLILYQIQLLYFILLECAQRFPYVHVHNDNVVWLIFCIVRILVYVGLLKDLAGYHFFCNVME